MACNKSNLLLTKTLPSLEAKREEEGILKGCGGEVRRTTSKSNSDSIRRRWQQPLGTSVVKRKT